MRPRLAWWLRVVLALLVVCCEVSVVGGRRRGRRDGAGKHRKDGSGRQFIEGLPEGCGGRQSTNADIFVFFTDAAAGKRTRAEIQAQADWIIKDLELGCTPRVRGQPPAHRSPARHSAISGNYICVLRRGWAEHNRWRRNQRCLKNFKV